MHVCVHYRDTASDVSKVIIVFGLPSRWPSEKPDPMNFMKKGDGARVKVRTGIEYCTEHHNRTEEELFVQPFTVRALYSSASMLSQEGDGTIVGLV